MDKVSQLDWDLLVAVDKGDEPLVRRLLADGANPGFWVGYQSDAFVRDEFQWDGEHTALSTAASRGHKALAQSLLTVAMPKDVLSQAVIDASIPFDGLRPEHLEIVRILVAAGAGFGSQNNNLDNAEHALLNYARIPLSDWRDIHDDAFHLLIELGAIEETPLDDSSVCAAIGSRRFDLMDKLIDKGAELDPYDNLSAIEVATHIGEFDIVKKLLEKGGLVRGRENNDRPLHIAVMRGRYDIMKLLLELGSHVESSVTERTTALHVAANNGKTPAIEILLDRGFEIEARDTKTGATPLISTVPCGRINALEMLIARGALIDTKDIKNSRTALHLACLEIANVNRKPRMLEKYSPQLHELANMIKILVGSGADIHAKDAAGQTPLLLVADVLIPEWRRSHRAPTHQSNRGRQSRRGLQRLHLPALNDRAGFEADMGTDSQEKSDWEIARELSVDSARTLLNAGANVNHADDDGLTALHIAASARCQEMASVLLGFGASVDRKDSNGRTPLHWAIQGKRFYRLETSEWRSEYARAGVMELLLHNGADITIRDNQDLDARGHLRVSYEVEMRGDHDSEDLAASAKLLEYSFLPNADSKHAT